MKNLILITVVIFASLLYSCEKEESTPDDGSGDGCNGKGTLHLENKSLHTVQRIIIDGHNYGTLDPGDKEEFSLAEGQHSMQFQGISGGEGCTPSTVFIVECEHEYFSCSN